MRSKQERSRILEAYKTHGQLGFDEARAEKRIMRSAPTPASGERSFCIATVRQELSASLQENAQLRIVNHRLTRELAEVAELQAEANRLAHRDDLTGLPNRLLLRHRVRQEVAGARLHGHKLGLLFIDLDGFKAVNDFAGHTIGDRLLTAVGGRILNHVRAQDIACRYGGDEFVVLLVNVGMPSVREIAAKIRARLSETYSIDGLEFNITASIGVALHPDDGQDYEALVAHADGSMYRSKAVRPRP